MFSKIIIFLRRNKKFAFASTLIVLCFFLFLFLRMERKDENAKPLFNETTPTGTPLATDAASKTKAPGADAATPIAQASTTTSEPSPAASGDTDDYAQLLAKAKRLAAGCLYDEAADLITSRDDYGDSPELQKLLVKWENEKASLVAWDVKKTTHVFFHSLIVDPQKAFNDSYKEEGYDNYMATVSEFNNAMEEMYKKGYILVTPYQLASLKEDKKGKKRMTTNKLMLPKGKKAFILSVDDVSYYQYMEGDGFASRLVLDENGRPVNEMDHKDGTVETGDFDVVPLLERFIEKHPDFSYQGARGILALTGYDGVLGYRTSKSQHENDKAFRKLHPDYDFKDECRKAKEVADGLKEAGWIFANHSYSHNNIGSKKTHDKSPLSYQAFKHDVKQWRNEVEPILGKTDILIFPQGTYLNEPGRADWKPYLKSNKRYQYLKKQGIRYYFGVGGYQPWVQVTNDYFRQDRINIDGTGMRSHPELYKPFFNPAKVYDSSRPPHADAP